MELKTISEIREMSAEALSRYYREVTLLEMPYSRSELRWLFNEIRANFYVIPTPEFVVEYLVAFIREHYEEILWKLISTEDTHAFADTGLWVFSWTINTSFHSLILTEEQRIFVQDALTALEAGVLLDNVEEINIALLEADTTNMANYSSLLASLQLTYTVEQTIPELSDTLSIDETTARFSSAVWFEEIQKKTIVLAGLGGIGSYCCFLLARMHPTSIFIYDDDKVESVNMAGQLYSTRDIGKYKVDAIANMVRDYSSYASIFAIRERFTAETETADVMICGFDNMEARKLFFDKWIEHVSKKSDEEKRHCLFIDGRLAAEELQVLCIRGEDDYNINRYKEEFCFSDTEADETLCSYKQTTYMANMIGSIIVNLFTNFVANEITEGLRDLPFFVSYSADSMMFKVEQ